MESSSLKKAEIQLILLAESIIQWREIAAYSSENECKHFKRIQKFSDILDFLALSHQ
jgi:hypothetical protein